MPEHTRCPVQHEPMALADLFEDPHGALRRHREAHWWTTMPELDTDCLSLTHADGRELLADGERLHADLRGFVLSLLRMNDAIAAELIDHYEQEADTFLVLNGDPHRRLRALFSRSFTPRQVERIMPFMKDTATRLAGELQPGDDFVTVFAAQFPGLVLCELTGIPEADRAKFVDWVETTQQALSSSRLLTMTSDESLEVLAAEQELAAYTTALIEQRRRRPGDDLVSRLVNDPGCHLSDDELAVSIGALIFAGNDTTRCLLGLLMVAMADHPEMWERLAADPGLADPVVEETLRWQGPVTAVSRVAAAPVEHRDCALGEGAGAVVSFWSANRDPAAYDRPDEFDPDRWSANPPGHLAFGHGAHYCLGASLARAETRIAAVALARHVTALRVVELEMRPPGGIQGPARLILDFEPRR